MQNAGLDEAQTGVKISGRNINNLRYADDTTFMAESEQKLKSLFFNLFFNFFIIVIFFLLYNIVLILPYIMKLKEESENVGLKLNIQKTNIMTSGPIILWQKDGETGTDFIFLGSKITADYVYSHEIKRCLLLGRKAMTNLVNILKSRDITDKGPSSQSYDFSSNHVWM